MWNKTKFTRAMPMTFWCICCYFEHFTPCFYCYLWATLNRLGSIDFKLSRFSWHLGCLCAILRRYPYWMTNLHTANKLARYLHTVNKMKPTRWSSLYKTHLEAVRAAFLINRFQPVHQQELVGAMLLRSSRKNGSSFLIQRGRI